MKSLLMIALLILGGCGKSEGVQDSGDLFKAPTLAGSAFKGMIFTGLAPDPSIPTGRTYQYDFTEGYIKALSNDDSTNAAVFSLGAKVLLFNRLEGHVDFRIITPGSSPSISDPKPLDLTPGDPFDAVSMENDKSAIIAEPLGGKLRVLDYTSGTLSSLGTNQTLAVEPLRPIGLLRESDQLAIIHTGLEVKGEGLTVSNGTQQIFTAKVQNPGTILFQDSDLSTNIINGLPLAGSNPSNFLHRKKTTARILSLCNPRIKACRSALEIFNNSRVTASTLWDDSFNYEFQGQIIDGPTEDQVFALVKSSRSQSLLVKIDLTTKSVEEIHSFASDRLFGIAFDSSTGTLFAGDSKDGLGSLVIYKDLKQISEISLDGVFYRGVFVDY